MAQHPANLETATHVAGTEMRVGKRHIQRCSICGEKLADSNDSDLRKFWTDTELVRARAGDDGRTVLYSLGKTLGDSTPRPRDLCIDLVE